MDLMKNVTNPLLLYSISDSWEINNTTYSQVPGPPLALITATNGAVGFALKLSYMMDSVVKQKHTKDKNHSRLSYQTN